MNQKDFKQIARESIILIGVSVVALIVLDNTTSIFKTPKEVIIEKQVPVIIGPVEIKEPKPKPSEFPDYDAYELFEKKVILVENNRSFVTKDYNKIGEIRKQFLTEGKFRRAYIFINASVDNGKPLTSYDSIYVTLNYKGGHILRNKSLAIPASNTTRLLYDMQEIPYITNVPYSENKQPLFVNWLAELNSGNNNSLYTFLSSWREGGLIEEISIVFECEENSSCDIILK